MRRIDREANTMAMERVTIGYMQLDTHVGASKSIGLFLSEEAIRRHDVQRCDCDRKNMVNAT